VKKSPSSQTAYEHNAHSSSSIGESNDHGWANAINRMIDQRYAFLALEYEDEGYLFRGMSAGLFEALLNNQFWHYSGNDSGSIFEKDLDVLLLSQDFSDALTVSKLWEQKSGACIIVFRSEIFNQALKEKRAAMMATAEPGVVFKYPFLTSSLTLEDIECLIVSNDLLEGSEFSEIDESSLEKLTRLISELSASGKLITVENTEENHKRSILEKTLMTSLLEREIIGAKAVNSDIKPVHKA
jgi:hypothetical protein